MTCIHATAVVHPDARVPDDVEIGPYCVVDQHVVIGTGCALQAHVTVTGHTTIGNGNRFFPGAVIGAEPQDLKYDGTPTRLVIGDDNVFREHFTVHPGTPGGGGITRVGSNGLYMAGSHVAHDCTLGDGVILANHVLLAGHVAVGDRAVFNGASACHHFTTVGRLAYVGGLTRITQDVHPFTIVEGHPSRVRGANVVGMRRSGILPEDVDIVKRLVYALFLSDKESTTQAMKRAESELADHPLVEELLASLRAAQCGRSGRAAESVGRQS